MRLAERLIDGIEEVETHVMPLLDDGISFVKIHQHFSELKKNLRMSESELRSFQISKLRRIVAHAYRTVPFYKELYSKHKIDPITIQSMSDLNKLPIINKNMLREIPFNQKISRPFLEKPLEKQLTGGSTGEPFTVYLSEEGVDDRKTRWLRILYLHGCNVFDKTATVAGMSGRARGGRLKRLRLPRTIEVPFDSSMSDQVKIMLNKKPAILVGYPSRLYLIAKYMRDNHVKIKTPKAVFTDSETLFPSMREAIEEVFGVKVTNVYDSYEFGYTSWECEKHDGLHIDSDSQVVQIMKDRVELEDGRSGNIVITDLENYAMPLIRYDTGDIGAKSGRKCDCGIVFPMLEGVLGRAWDFLLSPSGEEIAPLLVEQFVRKHRGVLEYQIVQNSKETLKVEMVVSRDYDYSADARIQQQLRDLYNFKEIVIHHPSHLERTKSGKLRCVIRDF